MARYYKVIGADTLHVVSSTGVSTVAPGGLASIYGENLAPRMESAALPLPVSLADVSVWVGDATGAVRQAQLYYASPSQINLVVPPGTAPGTSWFKVRSAGRPDITSTAEVRKVAPGLFSAEGSGSGLPKPKRSR